MRNIVFLSSMIVCVGFATSLAHNCQRDWRSGSTPDLTYAISCSWSFYGLNYSNEKLSWSWWNHMKRLLVSSWHGLPGGDLTPGFCCSSDRQEDMLLLVTDERIAVMRMRYWWLACSFDWLCLECLSCGDLASLPNIQWMWRTLEIDSLIRNVTGVEDAYLLNPL